MIFALFHKTILFSLIVMISFTHADTLEIYLNSDSKIESKEEAQDAGHTLVYYYFDGIDTIEERLAARATQHFEEEIKTLVKKEGLQHLTSLTEFQRNQLFLKQLNQSGSTIESITHSVITTQDREAIGHAVEDLIYAENNGVSKDMLPAILFRGKLYKNTNNLLNVIHEEDSQ